jgi:hypothetical protein
LISSKIMNIGRYMTITMPPTLLPMTTIMGGSMIVVVVALAVASTSDS